MEQKKKVRLSDIAKELNISTVTVSKAISNKEGVGDELRKQIKELHKIMIKAKISIAFGPENLMLVSAGSHASLA